MLETLKEQVYAANMLLPKYDLVIFTWGNVSGIDRDKKLIVIKPSGVSYDKLSPDNMVVVDFDANVIEGDFKPSSDTLTHIELYKNFQSIGGIVHTHSNFATSFAQARKPICCYGTTHADYMYGEIMCTRELTADEINTNYELNTGKVIVETMKGRDPLSMPAVLCANHGPFTWGEGPYNAVENAKVLEEVAQIAYQSMMIDRSIEPISKVLQDKHYYRKHGRDSYYGQK